MLNVKDYIRWNQRGLVIMEFNLNCAFLLTGTTQPSVALNYACPHNRQYTLIQPS